MAGTSVDSGYDFSEPNENALPVLLSVPHAGREYPDSLLARSRVTDDILRRLEDRYADHLVADLTARGFGAIIARTARAALDLNRDPRDIDRHIFADVPHDQPVIQSLKQRGGLGLFPRSLPRIGQLWRGQARWTEAAALIDKLHGGYHVAIQAAMDACQTRHGAVMLLDIHSMPPLAPPAFGDPRPDIVIGDRFGSSASTRFSELARIVAADHGYVVALNHPYSGYYLLERHGEPGRDRHALQIEVSRDLYLDEQLDQPSTGLARVKAMLSDLVEVLGEEVIRFEFPLAAE